MVDFSIQVVLKILLLCVDVLHGMYQFLDLAEGFGAVVALAQDFQEFVADHYV